MRKEIYRIKAYSTGGQGIKSLITEISKELSDKHQLKITSLVHYDSIVKGGLVEADLVISNYEINSPFIETADLSIILAEITSIHPSIEYIINEELKDRYTKENVEYIQVEEGREILKKTILVKILKHFSIEV